MPGNSNAFILSALFEHAKELQQLFRSDREFAGRLFSAIVDLQAAEDDAAATLALDQMMAVLLSSPLADVASEILRRSELENQMDPTQVRGIPTKPIPAEPDSLEARQQLSDLAGRLRYELAPLKSGPPAAAELEEAREAPPAEGEMLINIWIEDPPESPYEPLLIGRPYTLSCNVGRKNPATLVQPDDARVPEADIPSEGLLTEWLVTSTRAELGAVGLGTAVEIKQEGGETVWVAKFTLLVRPGEETEIVQLSVIPRFHGESDIEVLILVGSQIYRHLVVGLTAYSGGEPESAEPAMAIRTDTCLTPAAHLNLATTHEWTTPPGELTVQVLAAGLAGVYGDVAGESIATTVVWSASAPALAGKMENVRAAAERLRAKWDAYLNDVDSATLDVFLARLGPESRWPYEWAALPDFADGAHKQRWGDVERSVELRDLAVYGRQLYDAIFPRGTELRGWFDRLQPGHRVNIIWETADVSALPWGLMYLPAPPDPGDAVDPTGFLGLRLRIEYRPFKLPAGGKNLGDLNHAARAFFFYWGDQDSDPVAKEARWQRTQWSSLSNQLMLPTASVTERKQEMLGFFKDKHNLPITLLYMFCQCSVGEGNNPVLRFGVTNSVADVIKGTDLTWDLPERPLVFVNACTSSASDPYKVNDLESYFFSTNQCRGYLGTESKVPIEFASRFARVFFAFLFRLLDEKPMAAGEAVAQTRLFFWTHYRNIGGLFYTYLNQYELYLAEDAEVRALRR